MCRECIIISIFNIYQYGNSIHIVMVPRNPSNQFIAQKCANHFNKMCESADRSNQTLNLINSVLYCDVIGLMPNLHFSDSV